MRKAEGEADITANEGQRMRRTEAEGEKGEESHMG